MRWGQWRFTPPLWAWLTYALVLALLLNLGAWQLRRADAKAVMLAAQAEAAKQAPQSLQAWLDSGHSADGLVNQAVAIQGRYLVGQSLLQDSQVHAGRVGYHLWTPLRTPTGLILVNRGWLPAAADRRQLPEFDTPAGTQQLYGLWRPLPRPGLELGQADCGQGSWPRVVQYPRLEELQCLLQAPVVDGLLLLAPELPDGYVRHWLSGLMPPAKHYGYALQWFSLALALSVIFLWVNIHRATE